MTKRLRLQHKFYRTEQSYVGWIRQFYNFLKGKDPDLLSKDDVHSFMSFLAVNRRVAKSTHNVVWNPVLFLFRNTLDKEIRELEHQSSKLSSNSDSLFYPGYYLFRGTIL
ncbi:MAG: site-specific integrase [Verrucomicrobiota bacterium]|nr:site-specific integrase [Verrucomicrobiota bacterium]